MCGIVGYSGSCDCLPVLLDGLSMLEYRGYDSAGVSLANESDITTIKSVGNLSTLKEKLSFLATPESKCGIGHTRWATHGAPSDLNAHPQTTEKLSLVHNGIIENYGEIEDMLIEKGYKFKSETDTERAAALIDFYYSNSGDAISALFKACKLLKGSYAFAVIFKDIPNKIYAVRCGSPLIIGQSPNGCYVASDVPAILPYTKQCHRLDEGNIAEVSNDNILIYENESSYHNAEFEEVEWTAEQAKKGGYEHFMIKEIHEEPEVLRKMLSVHTKNGLPDLESVKYLLQNVKEVLIVACGTAMHAGLIGKYALEGLAHIRTDVEIASEFRYRNPILNKDTLVVLLSQSGETADTIAALRKAHEMGLRTLAVVNVFGSTLAREADGVIYTFAGPEIAVASTKAYSVQCTLLTLLALKFALINKITDEHKVRNLCNRICEELPSGIESTLSLEKNISEIADSVKDSEHLFYIGRGIDYALSLEASLKLKEISYIHSEAYPSGELKHGTISLITEKTPVISIITDPTLAAKSLLAVHEVASRGASVTLICSKEAADTCNISSSKEFRKIILPLPSSIIAPISAATAIQLLAYHVAAKKGLDVDKPRNLAKSVTVE